ncbi:hypothetical protein BMS3Bbin02_00187 [bacterium BMS3Bbin02]|nr:hypothetical protein BMS3Bbin02_00187 [bacterium BMS3Bbin02]
MTTDTRTRPDDESIINVIRVLVLLQGGIAFVSMLEVAFTTAMTGGSTIFALLLTTVAALLTLRLSTGIGKLSRRARRITIRIEKVIVVIAFLEVLLALLLAQTLPAPVTLITRFVVPVVVITLLRRPLALEMFGVPSRPERKQRRLRRTRTVGATR